MFKWNKNKISKLPIDRRENVKTMRTAMVDNIREAGKENDLEVLEFIESIGFNLNIEDYIDQKKFDIAFSDQITSMVTGGKLFMILGEDEPDK